MILKHLLYEIQQNAIFQRKQGILLHKIHSHIPATQVTPLFRIKKGLPKNALFSNPRCVYALMNLRAIPQIRQRLTQQSGCTG